MVSLPATSCPLPGMKPAQGWQHARRPAHVDIEEPGNQRREEPPVADLIHAVVGGIGGVEAQCRRIAQRAVQARRMRSPLREVGAMVVTMSPAGIGRLEHIVGAQDLDADRGPDCVRPVAKVEGCADAGDSEARRCVRKAWQRHRLGRDG